MFPEQPFEGLVFALALPLHKSGRRFLVSTFVQKMLKKGVKERST